jgi:hypothetical protein
MPFGLLKICSGYASGFPSIACSVDKYSFVLIGEKAVIP